MAQIHSPISQLLARSTYHEHDNGKSSCNDFHNSNVNDHYHDHDYNQTKIQFKTANLTILTKFLLRGHNYHDFEAGKRKHLTFGKENSKKNH